MNISTRFSLALMGCYLLCSTFNLVHAEQKLGKDPTQPAFSAATSPASQSVQKKQNWQLQAVTYSSNKQTAIINGKSYLAGQWLTKQVKLRQILPDAVVILVNNKAQTLTLRANKIKTEVNGAFN
ncbi:general secretion pathway protein GspB [Catenovulum adriaticum]|uniref:General secretion pathway protein GspB n=1 Tax=Catenovulum adriaticum TaxID=2984846 RepID=A0ABY7AKH9_9ALTE|nr:general secretion pathway protein GspB [Catenovulum sp. TS8]WAJ70055.1 general secretion pathway protein GspB [Catenovulum sp. TS8]